MCMCPATHTGATCSSQIQNNDCLNGNSNCHANATCAPNFPGFNCTCQTGFTGSGVACTGERSTPTTSETYVVLWIQSWHSRILECLTSMFIFNSFSTLCTKLPQIASCFYSEFCIRHTTNTLLEQNITHPQILYDSLCMLHARSKLHHTSLFLVFVASSSLYIPKLIKIESVQAQYRRT